jgi:hypothetical protein
MNYGRCAAETIPAPMKRHNDPAPTLERAELERQVESLRRNARSLCREHDILRKADAQLKNGQGAAPLFASNRGKGRLVDALRNTYARPALLAALGLARRSCLCHSERPRAADKYIRVRQVLTGSVKLSYRSNNGRRMRTALGRPQALSNIDTVELQDQAGNVYLSPSIACVEFRNTQKYLTQYPYCGQDLLAWQRAKIGAMCGTRH